MNTTQIFKAECSEDSDASVTVLKNDGTLKDHLTFRFQVSESNEVVLHREQVKILMIVMGGWLNE
jgi:hypothetical protein